MAKLPTEKQELVEHPLQVVHQEITGDRCLQMQQVSGVERMELPVKLMEYQAAVAAVVITAVVQVLMPVAEEVVGQVTQAHLLQQL
jgi:hypothetical protein